eukprot:554191-Rhodomonas_salina.2
MIEEQAEKSAVTHPSLAVATRITRENVDQKYYLLRSPSTVRVYQRPAATQPQPSNRSESAIQGRAHPAACVLVSWLWREGLVSDSRSAVHAQAAGRGWTSDSVLKGRGFQI